MTLPTLFELRTHYEVYPGQPLVCAACIIQLFASPEEAAAPTEHGWFEAESHSDIPGAGGQTTKAVEALLAYRQHGDLDRVISELHTAWRRTISPGNYPERFEPGQRKAEALAPVLREALAAWFDRCADVKEAHRRTALNCKQRLAVISDPKSRRYNTHDARMFRYNIASRAKHAPVYAEVFADDREILDLIQKQVA